MTYHTLMVFSFLSVYQNLQELVISYKEWFLTKQIAAWKCTTLFVQILQHIGRVATPKVVPRNCLRYLQTILIMGGRGIGIRIYVRYCRLFSIFFFSLNGFILITSLREKITKLIQPPLSGHLKLSSFLSLTFFSEWIFMKHFQW